MREGRWGSSGAGGWKGVRLASAGLSGIVIAWLVLSATVAAALALPTSGYLDVGPAGRVRFASARLGIAPLTDVFVRRVLGGTTTTQPTAADVARPRRPAVATPLVVEHAFTNDRAERAFEIERIPFTARTNTRGATTLRSGAEGCSPNAGAAWYRYTAISPGRLLADTFGTNYPLWLGVFVGEPGAFRVVTCWRGANGNADANFDATTGTTYYIAVMSDAQGGDLVFRLSPEGSFETASVSSNGHPNDEPRTRVGDPPIDIAPAITPDARFVAFSLVSGNLDPHVGQSPTCVSLASPAGVHRRCAQVFIRDRTRTTTETASVGSNGAAGNGDSYAPALSDDGRFVAFYSDATNLARFGAVAPGATALYVRDLLTRATELVAVTRSPLDAPATRPRAAALLSADGRNVAYAGADGGLYLCDRVTRTTKRLAPRVGAAAAMTRDGRFVLFTGAGDHAQLYRLDRATGTVDLVSRASSGAPANAAIDASSVSVSADGRYVAFQTDADNLVDDDTNRMRDAFWRDTASGETRRVSVSSTGVQGTPPRNEPPDPAAGTSMSADGQVVLFSSPARNLTTLSSEAVGGFLYRHDLVTAATTSERVGRGVGGAAVNADASTIAYYSILPTVQLIPVALVFDPPPQAIVKTKPT